MSYLDKLLRKLNHLDGVIRNLETRVSQSMRSTGSYNVTYACRRLQRQLANARKRRKRIQDQINIIQNIPAPPAFSAPQETGFPWGWVVAAVCACVILYLLCAPNAVHLVVGQ
jgi:hypothetical protein